jgi:hypothetical protein
MMADSEGEENTMRTNQPDMVRQSLEATAHPDVYARRKVAALGAVLARTDVPLASAEKVVEVVLDAVGTQDLVTEHRERRAAEGDHDDPDHCTCPTSAPDAFGNCDLIEQDDCPVHGSGYLPGEAPEIGPAADDAERVVGEVFQSFGTRVLGLSPDASLDEIRSALDAAPMPHRPIAHDGQGGIRYMTIDEMRDAGHPLPDSADTRLQGYEIGYRNGESSMLADIDTACDQLGIEYEGHPLTALRGMADIGRRREGWRGRLAHIEMLLAKARESAWNSPDEGKIDVIEAESIDQALAELRALIDEA